MFDYVFRNATIIDGTGSEAFTGDVALKDGRIETIAPLIESDATEVVDCVGKTLSPGFIDMHSHADAVILGYPRMESMVFQGITTFVACQCGHSIAPVGSLWEGSQALYHLYHAVSGNLYADMYGGINYSSSEKIIPLIEKEFGFSPRWESMGEFMDEVDAKGLSGNMITLAGYNTLRLINADPDKKTFLTDKQKDIIKGQIRECLEAGAFGMSTGLDYKPGIFAETTELIEMAEVLKRTGGIYFSHWRKTGLRSGTPKKQKKINGIREAMDIGLANDVQVQISHISNGYDVYPSRDDDVHRFVAEKTLAVVDGYHRKGCNVYFDVIPNIVVGTIIQPDLVSYFYPWLLLAGNRERFSKLLGYNDFRAHIRDYVLSGQYFWLNPVNNADWDEYMTVTACNEIDYVNKTISETAAQLGKSSIETVFDLLVNDPYTKVFMPTHSMNFEGIRTYLKHPLATVGNDTFVFDLVGSMHYDSDLPRVKPNPNTYCGFIKFLMELSPYEREEAVRRLTGLPADILGLSDRGYVKEGYRADILLLDFDNMQTRESYIEPRVYPKGVTDVFVNGVPVICNAQHTGEKPGGTIRSYKR